MASMMEKFDLYVQIIENNILKVKSDKKAALRLIEEIVLIDFYDHWCVGRLIKLVKQYQKEEICMWNCSNIWTFNGKVYTNNKVGDQWGTGRGWVEDQQGGSGGPSFVFMGIFQILAKIQEFH